MAPRRLGFVAAAAVLVSGSILQIGYLVALPFQVGAGVPNATALDPGEPPIVLAFLAATAGPPCQRTTPAR